MKAVSLSPVESTMPWYCTYMSTEKGVTYIVRPDKSATVFAGGDDRAVAHLRGILSDYPPSSPSIALFQNGKPVYMMHRHDIEQRDAFQIAQLLKAAFEKFCAKKEVPV